MSGGKSTVSKSGSGSDSTPAGSDTEIQYNSAGAFGASSRLTFDPATGLFKVTDSNGNILLVIDPANGNYNFGDVDGAGNGCSLFITDSAKTISLASSLSEGKIELVTTLGFCNLNGGLVARVNSFSYGTTNTVQVYHGHLYVTGSTGATTFNLSGTYAVGQIFKFSDLDRISDTSNITIDAGTGNTIVTSASAAQTFVMATAGLSVTIQKVTDTQWMLIARNT